MAWAKVYGGYQVAAPLDDYVGRAAFFAGELDRKITWICRRIVRPGDYVLDVGANLGLVTMILAKLVGPAGRVEAFEPVPAMCDLIQQAIERNQLPNIRLHRMALGAEAGEHSLSVPNGHAGSASFLPELRFVDQYEVRVPVRTLSEMTAGTSERARLLKIDVEGFESQVLAGGAEYFDRLPPETVLFELYDLDAADHPTVRFHLDRGYRLFSIPRSLVRMRLLPFDGQTRGHDYLAVHPDVYDSIAPLVS
jgi:FkbM family methyltransferase